MLFVFLINIQAKSQNTPLTESFNYSKIEKHPRLLLSKEEDVVLKKAIANIPEFKKIE